MKYTRRDLDLAAMKKTLFLDDPRTWPIWDVAAWLLPPVLFGLIPLGVYLLWRAGEIR